MIFTPGETPSFSRAPQCAHSSWRSHGRSVGSLFLSLSPNILDHFALQRDSLEAPSADHGIYTVSPKPATVENAWELLRHIGIFGRLDRMDPTLAADGSEDCVWVYWSALRVFCVVEGNGTFEVSFHSKLSPPTIRKFSLSTPEAAAARLCAILQKVCWGCFSEQEQSQAAFKTCGRCNIPSYCSKECQRHHWKLAHKRDCYNDLLTAASTHPS
jgi:hypothetical protein